MSLNGLDAPEVLDAHQTAVGEAGGWLLLKYASRDAVELLGRGKNGVAEARDAIQKYPDASPLYGLIMYRRRKILIKYIPEGTSRLLQARTAVHSSDFLDKFSPYETILDISSPDGLNDTSLAASFQLHTAAPSPSPSASRLDEIREDGEDGGLGHSPDARTSSRSAAGAQMYKADKRLDGLKKRTERAERVASTLPAVNSPLPELKTSAPPPQAPPKQKPSVSQYLVREESGHTSITSLQPPHASDTASREAVSSDNFPRGAEALSDSTSQRSMISNDFSSEDTEVPPSVPPKSALRTKRATDLSERDFPEIPAEPSSSSMELHPRTASPYDEEPFDFSQYDALFKKKVKLGPRPVNSPDKTNRPSAARVAAMPSNLKAAPKKQEPAVYRPTSSNNSMQTRAAPAPASPVTTLSATQQPLRTFQPSPAVYMPAPPPIPDTPEYDHRPVSRGSIKSAASHKTVMTADKLRLMKAIELRKKQLRRSREQQDFKPPTDDEVPEVPEIPEQMKVTSVVVSNPGEQRTETEAEHLTDDEKQLQSNKADSGIEIHYRPDGQVDVRVEGHSIQQGLPDRELAKNEVDESPAKQHHLPADTNEKARSTAALAQDEATEPEDDATPPAESKMQVDDAEQEEQIGKTTVPDIVMADGSRPKSSGGSDLNASFATAEEGSERQLSEKPSNSDFLEAAAQRRQNSAVAKRRQGFVEPLQTDTNTGNPDDFETDVSDDDSFYEELQSATVQEAKPITVARSPVAGSFPPRKPSADTITSVRSVNISRAATTPLAESPPDVSDRIVPDAAKSRPSISPPAEKPDAVSGYSRNVSSGISRRIQALAEMSNRESLHALNGHQARPLTPEAPNSFLHQDRKPRSARPNSYRRLSSNRGNQNQPSQSTTGPDSTAVWSVQHDPTTNRNSVSVSARIIRPAATGQGDSRDSESLRQSDLTLNSQRQSQMIDELPPLNTSVVSPVASLASSPVLTRNSVDARTMHSASRFGRHRKNSVPTRDESPPPQAKTPSVRSNDEASNHKDGSRTSRFFKRMSNFAGPRRKNSAPSAANASNLTSIPSHTTLESSNRATSRLSVATEKDLPPPVVVGDLNVQFPDSLLWKRRIVTIDEAGNLQFAIAQAMEIHKGVAFKKFALTDFRQPFAPDLERQELPHSVVLEFHDGTALQAACEDAMTQRQVLSLLKTYWKAWTMPAV